MGYAPQGAAVVGPTVATKIVAASDSLETGRADYICDGISDEDEINAAIGALPSYGGVVYLLEGTYVVDGAITIDKSNVALIGAGAGTVIKIKDGYNADIDVISADTKDHLLIANLKIDGNKANQTAGAMRGIWFDTVTDSKIVHCWVEDMLGSVGVVLEASSNNTISGNTCQGNGRHGIALYTSSNNNTVTGNTCRGNSQEEDNHFDGIIISSNSDYNNVQGNTVRHAGGAKQHRYGIRVNSSDCDGNLITNNDLYLAGKTANLSDAGTGTVTASGNRT